VFEEASIIQLLVKNGEDCITYIYGETLLILIKRSEGCQNYVTIST